MIFILLNWIDGTTNNLQTHAAQVSGARGRGVGKRYLLVACCNSYIIMYNEAVDVRVNYVCGLCMWFRLVNYASGTHTCTCDWDLSLQAISLGTYELSPFL